MARYRWLNADWPIAIDTLAARIKTKPFTSEVRHGFVIDRVRKDFLDARYIERIEYKDSVIDPFGKELIFDRIEFRKSVFRISALQPSIELYEPPRSVQPLINQLSELVDFELSVSTSPVNVLSWAEEIQKLLTRKSIIDSIQINSLSLMEHVTAKMIVKGNIDVRLAYQDITKNKKYSLEKIQLRFDGIDKGFIVLGSTGSATIEIDDPTGDIISSIRFALSELKF